MRLVSDYERFDPQRVNTFVDAFNGLTLEFTRERRAEEIDRRIGNAELTLADKIEAFKRLAPPGKWNLGRDELRMERLLCSVETQDLSLFKYALEYDGDSKDLEEYLCHDIDDEGCRDRVVEHLRTAPLENGVKVLSDVDDTMFANLVDERYPRSPAKAFYPGVLEFYDALKREPFTPECIPVTTLSARPGLVAGIAELHSLKTLVDRSAGRLSPSALSGDLVSSTVGTFETFARSKLESLIDSFPHGQEDEIGVTKFKNFANFATVYPEYRYVFVGDSGQADALTAQLMLAPGVAKASSRVITTFIHDLRQSEEDKAPASAAFRRLFADHVMDETFPAVIDKTSPAGRGVIVFRNYIDAATIAYAHSKSLDNLITAESLARITRAALGQFREIDFQAEGKEASGQRLRQQYLEDAVEAYTRLTLVTPRPDSLEKDVTEILHMLEGEGV